MKKAILATKVGMTQIFNEDGMLIPVTVLQAGPCVVTQVKTEENDGYTSVQVGFGEIREKLVNKPEKGHFDKAGVAVKRFVKEFRFDNAGEYEVGQEIKADIFAAGDHIDATAVSKGKGFQGAIKRHGQSRGPMAHGIEETFKVKVYYILFPTGASCHCPWVFLPFSLGSDGKNRPSRNG